MILLVVLALNNAKRTADSLINSLYGGTPSSTGSPSSPSTGTPTSLGNLSISSTGGRGSSADLGPSSAAAESARRVVERNGDVSGVIGDAQLRKSAEAAANAADASAKHEKAKEDACTGNEVYQVVFFIKLFCRIRITVLSL